MNEVYERPNGTRGVRTVIEGSSLTKQSFKDECDVNNIMKRFERTGLITHNAAREAYYADVSVVPDFATAIEVVRKADQMFSSLPAKLRQRFNNDAASYVAFCSDPANLKEMQELGLTKVPDVAKPIEVIVTNPAITEVK